MKFFIVLVALAIGCNAMREEDLYQPWPGCPNAPQGPEDDVKLEVADNCNQFIHCESFGKPQLKVCAPSNPALVFDQDFGMCVWPWESTRHCNTVPDPPTQETTSPTSPPNTTPWTPINPPPNNGGCECVRLPKPGSCNEFLECCAKVKTCPSGLQFNPTKGECDFPNSCGCKY